MKSISSTPKLFVCFLMAFAMLCSCEKDPEKDTYKNLSKNSPWMISSLKTWRYSNYNTNTADWDTTLYNYAELVFKKDQNPGNSFTNSTGELILNGNSDFFQYSVGSAGGKVIISINLGETGTFSFYPEPTVGKEMILTIAERKYVGSGQTIFPTFLQETGYYDFQWNLTSKK